jgi:hypothetical protein
MNCKFFCLKAKNLKNILRIIKWISDFKIFKKLISIKISFLTKLIIKIVLMSSGGNKVNV